MLNIRSPQASGEPLLPPIVENVLMTIFFAELVTRVAECGWLWFWNFFNCVEMLLTFLAMALSWTVHDSGAAVFFRTLQASKALHSNHHTGTAYPKAGAEEGQ
jgi:hypothetical protein